MRKIPEQRRSQIKFGFILTQQIPKSIHISWCQLPHTSLITHCT